MKELRLYLTRLFLIACAVLIVSCDEKKQFDGYLYPIRENGLYGYIDSVGNRIIEPEFLWVSTFHNGLAMAVVDTIYREVPDSMAYEVGERDTIINVYRMYAKYGYIDKSGDFVIEPKFISYVNMPEKGYVAKDMDDCRNALYRHTFRNRRAMFYDTITWKNGYIDTKGNVAIEAKYYYSEPFSDEVAVVRDAVADPIFTNGACINPSRLRCAYIDTLGNNVTAFKYETLTRCLANRGIGTYKVIHKKSVELGDTTVQLEEYNEPCFLLNNRGLEIKELDLGFKYYGYSIDGITVALHDFLWRIRGNKEFFYFDEDGKRLEPLKGLSEHQLDSLSRSEDIIQVLPYNLVISRASFFNEGFAGISPDGEHWLVIDKFLLIHGYGKESIFDGFRAFNNGLAAVKKNGKWGFINRKIKEQIPCKYDSCGVVYPYLEEVFKYDIQGEVQKKAYINRKDSLVWESPIYKSEKIENRYSVKDRKDWGQWVYKYNPIKEYLPFLILGVIVVLFILLAVVWKITSNRHPKVADKELVTRREPELEVVPDVSPIITTEADPDEILSYPTVGQYTETIMQAAKSPDDYFDKLKHLRPILDSNGEPIMSGGNFAVVFKMKDEYGKQYAVRCFHRAQQGREKNYKLICEELAKVSSPYLSPIKYYDKELFVDSDEYPVLLMDWVEGMTLDKYIRQIINDKKALRQLTDNFRKLSIWLLSQPFAHGDLKPDNILVKKDGSLVLVDYDGMYVPAMQGQRAREIGSPDFRNPSRTEDEFNKDIDNFPIVSILLSLELLVENKEYLSLYGAEDRLLFSEEDYLDIENSNIYKRAYSSYNDDMSNLAKLLKSLLNDVEIDNEILNSTINGERWRKELHANDKVEKTVRIFYVIYTIALFVFPFAMRSAEWSILDISFIMLIANIVFLIVLNIVDLCRPSKKYHIHAEREGGTGCLGMIALFIPVLLMTDIVSDGMINQSKYLSLLDLPSYNEDWYITLLIWIIWYFSFLVYGQIFDNHYEYRLKYFKTETERNIEIEEREKENIRSDIRKEDEQREKKQKEMEERKRRGWYEDLPF